MSGVLLLEPVVLFGVELEFGLVDVEPEVPLMSELLDEELGLVDVLELELEDGEVEFMSELLELEDGEVEFMSELLDPVVDDGEVEVLDPDWLDEVDGVLCEL